MSEHGPNVFSEPIDAALFLKLYRDDFINDPEKIEEAISHLTPQNQKEVLDDFLNNFFFYLPGGFTP